MTPNCKTTSEEHIEGKKNDATGGSVFGMEEEEGTGPEAVLDLKKEIEEKDKEIGPCLESSPLRPLYSYLRGWL